MNFILSIVLSAMAVLILVLIPWVGVGALNLSGFFGVFLPYVALIV
ncbi:MAG: menaquinol oxidoreductase, partial [Desulfobacteraceae bacterium]